MKRILKYVSKYKGTVIIGTMCMLIVIGVDLFLPYLQQVFIDSGLMKGNQNVIVSVLVWIGIITIIKAMLGYGKEFLYDVLSSWVHQDIKNDLFAHIQTLEFEYFDNMNTGELMSRIGEDAENIWQTIGYGMRLFIENIIYFVISTIILFVLNYKLALACFIVMIPIGFIGIKLENKFGETYSKISDQTAEINTIAQEDIAGIKLVKAFSPPRYRNPKLPRVKIVKSDLSFSNCVCNVVVVTCSIFCKSCSCSVSSSGIFRRSNTCSICGKWKFCETLSEGMTNATNISPINTIRLNR